MSPYFISDCESVIPDRRWALARCPMPIPADSNALIIAERASMPNNVNGR